MWRHSAPPSACPHRSSMSHSTVPTPALPMPRRTRLLLLHGPALPHRARRLFWFPPHQPTPPMVLIFRCCDLVDQQLATTAVAGYSSCEAGSEPDSSGLLLHALQPGSRRGYRRDRRRGRQRRVRLFVAGRSCSGHFRLWRQRAGVYTMEHRCGRGRIRPIGSRCQRVGSMVAGRHCRSRLCRRRWQQYALCNSAWQPVPPQLQPGTAPPTDCCPISACPRPSIPTPIPAWLFASAASIHPTAALWCARRSAASASLFAGIAALIAQKYGAQGNLAPISIRSARRTAS